MVQVPRLNELAKKYGDRGLTVIGVTDASKSFIERLVREQSVHHAFAEDKSGNLARALGIELPCLVLVDAAGTIVWSGWAGKLDDATIEKHISGALPEPIWKLPRSARRVRQALRARHFDDALEAAHDLGAEEEELARALEALVARRLAALEELFAAGDYRRSKPLAAILARELAGLDAGARATEITRTIRKDANVRSILKAQQRIAAIRDDLGGLKKKRVADRLLQWFATVPDELPGSCAAREASALGAELLERRAHLD